MYTVQALINDVNVGKIDEDLKAAYPALIIGVSYNKPKLRIHCNTQPTAPEETGIFAIVDAHNPADLSADELEFQAVKDFGVAIKNALNAIDVPGAIGSSYDVLDTDGLLVLFTLPDDTTWAGYTNAQVKDYVRQMAILQAMMLDYIVAQKAGYWEIKKYINKGLFDS